VEVVAHDEKSRNGTHYRMNAPIFFMVPPAGSGRRNEKEKRREKVLPPVPLYLDCKINACKKQFLTPGGRIGLIRL
jgi:hypothetical protein